MQKAPLRSNHEGETVRSLGPCARLSCGRSMCGRARLSTDVSEIKLVFSIPPHRPTPNFPPSWNVAPTDPLPVVRYDTKAGECSLDLLRGTWSISRSGTCSRSSRIYSLGSRLAVARSRNSTPRSQGPSRSRPSRGSAVSAPSALTMANAVGISVSSVRGSGAHRIGWTS